MTKHLLSSNRCGNCDLAKELLKDDIANGKIDVVYIDQNKGYSEIARLFGGVPTLIEENDGQIFELKLITNEKKRG